MRDEVHSLRTANRHLDLELRALRPQSYREGIRIGQLEAIVRTLRQENRELKQKLADLSLKQKPQPPVFVKANVKPKAGKNRPGRRVGHEPAHRPVPETIDVHRTIDVPVDSQGQPSCPHCCVQLSDVKHHDRIVEDLIPAKVVVTCYHATSGYCPGCRKRIESRAPEQPPAADIPHGQLGLNALATAAVMRVCYRMPLRQIAKLFKQLPGLSISPGAIVKQLTRISSWLEGQYERLKVALRIAGVVHADETGWRTNGKNGYLWTLTNDRHTLYHVDHSRGAKVIVDLLGKAFGTTPDGKGQTLVSDFYGVYDRIDSRQQKCLAHLLRELKDTAAKRPELKRHAFFVACKRLARAMIKLKTRQAAGEAKKYARAVKRLEAKLKDLSEQKWDDLDAARLTKRLAKHRQSLTTFLHHAEVDATNNAAERALRPAVVMRKITGGSRSKPGAKAWSILASVMRTAEQQGRDVLATIKTLLIAEWSGQNIALLTDTS